VVKMVKVRGLAQGKDMVVREVEDDMPEFPPSPPPTPIDLNDVKKLVDMLSDLDKLRTYAKKMGWI
jgi:hypothetical protein